MTVERRKLALFYWALFALLVVGGFLLWFFFIRFYAFTNDAYVEGNQIYITPLKAGFVTAIHTDDTFLVEKGALIVELDKTDSTIALELAKKELAQTVRDVCQMFHQVFAYRAEIETKKAELIRAAQDYKHRVDVIEAEAISVEDLEHAVAALRASFFSLKMTKQLYNKALSAVQNTSIHDHPLILAKSSQVRNAWVQLYRCNLYAPESGLVAQRTIQVGMWADAGKALMSVIPLDQIWVNANFKETQMKRMRIGQSVRITSDLYGKDVFFRGKIVGLPGGAGNAFSLLPPQNLSGNWIKIVQRLPVRVELDLEDLKTYPLRIGLSMEALVNLHQQEGGLVPTSSEGAPLYSTPIFEKEEEGDANLIEGIIIENLDPTLQNFLDAPLELSIVSLDLSELKEYICDFSIFDE